MKPEDDLKIQEETLKINLHVEYMVNRVFLCL